MCCEALSLPRLRAANTCFLGSMNQPERASVRFSQRASAQRLMVQFEDSSGGWGWTEGKPRSSAPGLREDAPAGHPVGFATYRTSYGTCHIASAYGVCHDESSHLAGRDAACGESAVCSGQRR